MLGIRSRGANFFPIREDGKRRITDTMATRPVGQVSLSRHRKLQHWPRSAGCVNLAATVEP